MILVLCSLFAVAALAPVFFAGMGRNAFYVLAAAPAAAFVWLIFQYPAAYGQGLTEHVDWIPELQLDLTFRMDPLSWVMCLLVLGVGALVLAYCARYFKDKDANLGSFGAQLLAFAGAMFGLVTADDLILMFVFWELTTILSYLLIGYARARISARRSALTALIVTTAGGLTMLIGLIMLAQLTGTSRVSGLLERAPALLAAHDGAAMAALNVAVVLVLVGAITKSALVPFHFWLPGAMAAPTPVSAYLHAAAMVKAGIYLVARLAPGLSGADSWLPVILTLGLATMLVGGYRALRQKDIKLILAFGTVSQLGFLTMVVGLGTPEAALAGLGLLLAHGLFKAALFLVVGIIDHQTGTRDVGKLSGVFRSSRALGVVAVVAAASMAGIPPLAGFVAKESVFTAFVEWAGEAGHAPWGPVVLAGMVLGSILTFAYSARFIWGAFAMKPGVPPTPFKPIRFSFLAAPALLAVLSVVYGVWPAPVDSWIQPYAALFAAGAPGDAGGHGGTSAGHLELWHGVTPALGLTAVTFLVGSLLVWGRDAVSRFQSSLPKIPEADKAYQNVIGALDDVAVWVTGRTQRGSLFFYLVVILAVAVAVPVGVLLWNGKPIPSKLYWIDPGSPLQWLIGLGIVVGAFGAVKANKRFMAVLFVSVTGYGMALIFALQSAPDLALTQMLVETVALVAFVLAMRRLPPELRDRTGGRYRVIRVVLGLAFGAAMVVFALFAADARVATPISLDFPKLAYEQGGGLNVVNVTLVDLRAWDTFGEISVLALAATGVASLIFVRSIGHSLGRSAGVETGSVGRVAKQPTGSLAAAALATARRFGASPSTVGGVRRNPWLVAGRTLAPERRSILFEVVTRLIFHTMVVFSVYLLFAGHNLPGGGFAGGLMAGMALTIRYLAGGRFELAEALRMSPGLVLGLGLALAAVSGLAPFLLGGNVFQAAILHFTLPVFGDVKFVTSTFFDIGVYLVVIGLVLDVLRGFGAQIDVELEEESEVAAR
ncbi:MULTISPECIES: Na+/H+ antiporter subunit A [Arthrobacter]|uniref:Na+/H+ antiporter subunit A n=2 Tax=Arthrobacter TaxID=1663 RepID=A0ABU9KLL6_9MICC|nr:Na+/H+ antiporter subunit A [Arthrobacter sp. YJM1]MDP5226752.1 Na+/H+ antiporter subunit A [Arthrobacter sp. YJM1]